MTPLNHQHIFSVFAVHPKKEGVSHRRLGKFALHNNHLSMLEDHSEGLLSDLTDGPVTPDVQRVIRSLMHSQSTRVVNNQDILDGREPDFVKDAEVNAEQGVIPEAEAPGQVTPPSSFHYQVHADPTLHTVETRGNVVRLNGKDIDDEAVKGMLDQVAQGLAQIQYKYPMKSLAKAAAMFENLGKSEGEGTDSLSEGMAALREAVKAGHLPRSVLDTISQELYRDSMVPSIGNKRAYNDFVAKGKEGVWLTGDGDSFKQINDTYGHEVGDEAIKAMGNAWREAADTAVGRANSKAWRYGGDEMRLRVSTPEEAAAFARELRNLLSKIPPIGGTHQLCMSIGIGNSPEDSDRAMYLAKDAKKRAGYAPGHSKMHVYSLVPGSEGPVPVTSSAVPTFSVTATPEQPAVPVQQTSA